MKKIYLLGFALCAFAFAGTAQVELTDDFESYNLGDISAQASHWRTWSGDEGGDEEGQVTNILANSGSQSLTIGPGTPPDGGPQDQLLLIPNAPNSGIYTVQWQMYIPAGKSGYFNMQALLSSGVWTQALMGGNVYFNCDGASGGSGRVTGGTDCEVLDGDDVFSYPEDEWFTMSAVYNLDDEVWTMNINGTEQFADHTFEFGPDQTFLELAAIDFYAANETNTFYMDDLVLAEGVLGVDNFSADVFSVYPNPVKDVLNIESAAAVNAVTVYDILGKAVLSAQPDAISPSIDMSGLSSGAYLVQVTIDGASKTVKVIK